MMVLTAHYSLYLHMMTADRILSTVFKWICQALMAHADKSVLNHSLDV